MFLLCFVESFFVHVESLLAGDVAGDFEGKSISGVEVEGAMPIEN